MPPPHRFDDLPISDRPVITWLAVSLTVLVLSVAAFAAEPFIVEDWTKHTVGVEGVPRGWKGPERDRPTDDFSIVFTLVQNERRKALRLKSKDDGSTIAKDIKGMVKLKETPILEWTWAVKVLPTGANSCRKETDDQAGQLLVAFSGSSEPLPSRVIAYVWDTTQPVGTICKSEKAGAVTYVVVRSGEAELGTFVTESRNVLEDFKKIYGEEPANPAIVSLAIDSNDTHTSAEAFFGPIKFRQP
jgi:Protein of unknown function (DUF3047)